MSTAWAGSKTYPSKEDTVPVILEYPTKIGRPLPFNVWSIKVIAKGCWEMEEQGVVLRRPACLRLAGCFFGTLSGSPSPTAHRSVHFTCYRPGMLPALHPLRTFQHQATSTNTELAHARSLAHSGPWPPCLQWSTFLLYLRHHSCSSSRTRKLKSPGCDHQLLTFQMAGQTLSAPRVGANL